MLLLLARLIEVMLFEVMLLPWFELPWLITGSLQVKVPLQSLAHH
jgi:hypothetical protein